MSLSLKALSVGLFLMWSSHLLGQDENTKAFFIAKNEGTGIDFFTQSKDSTGGRAYSIYEGWIESQHDKALPFAGGRFSGSFPPMVYISDEPNNTFTQDHFPPMGIGGSYMRIDSFVVEGKLYHIAHSHSDDGYVGGRPNQVDVRVYVDSLGAVYSFSNFFNAHEYVMVSHSDSVLNEVLRKVFEHGNLGGYSSESLLSLNEFLPCQEAVNKIKSQWKTMRKHLQISDIHQTDSLGQVTYRVEISNNSNQTYLLPHNTLYGPAYAINHKRHRSERTEISQTYYSIYFHRLQESVFLEPGATYTFEKQIRSKFNCGQCSSVSFEGLQIIGNRDIYSWLLGISGQIPHHHFYQRYLYDD